VEEEGEPAPLVLLGRDQLLEEVDAVALLAATLPLTPLERRLRQC
jgi:hypothetical protein